MQNEVALNTHMTPKESGSKRVDDSKWVDERSDPADG